MAAVGAINRLRAFAFYDRAPGSSPPGLVVVSSLLGEAVTLALALWVFHLLFWGYATLVLQFDREVRAAFPEAPAES